MSSKQLEQVFSFKERGNGWKLIRYLFCLRIPQTLKTKKPKFTIHKLEIKYLIFPGRKNEKYKKNTESETQLL